MDGETSGAKSILSFIVKVILWKERKIAGNEGVYSRHPCY